MGWDPLAEKYKEIGSYVYCADNPINLFDPDGQKFIYNAQGKFLRKEGKIILYILNEMVN